MPFFKKKQKDASPIAAAPKQSPNPNVPKQTPTSPPIAPSQRDIPKREDGWMKKEVTPEDVQELLHLCTQALKQRALDVPFFFLPFRPNTRQHLSDTRAFVRRFFRGSVSGQDGTTSSFPEEIRLLEPMVLCGVIKWCWSRLKGGVITWKTYEMFRVGEQESNMDKQAFDTFLPLSCDSSARQLIILDFFDLLAAIAAHSRSNGLGGRKLSRLAGWWAFQQTSGRGFEAGYKSWLSAADATSHMFFAYLRARSPQPGAQTISQLPRSLQTLVAETEYPPETPRSLQSIESNILMVVDTVSPSPFDLLQRASELEYAEGGHVLPGLANSHLPAEALSAECRRVLDMMVATTSTGDGSTSPPLDAAWTRFEDLGFSALGTSKPNGTTPSAAHSRTTSTNDARRVSSRPDQSWAEFTQSGFLEDDSTTPPPLALPSKQYMPLIDPDDAPVSVGKASQRLRPAELASIEQIALDETFWWVWMESLAPEEPLDRKAVFGRCICVELEFSSSRWLVVEEQLKPVLQEIKEEVRANSPEKKRGFMTKKSRQPSGQRQVSGMSIKRGTSTQYTTPVLPSDEPLAGGTYSTQDAPLIDINQHALIQAAAAQLMQKVQADELNESVAQRRGRKQADADAKTVSVLSMQPVFVKDAAPALQWARKFDKEITRARSGNYTDSAEDVSGPKINADVTPSAEHTSMEDVALQTDSGTASDTQMAQSLAGKEEMSETPQKMVPSPLRIPKRKPVGSDQPTESPLRTVSGVNGKEEPDDIVDEPTVMTESTAERPRLQQSKSGSKRGLRDLFKRRTSSQRAVSDSTTASGQQESKPQLSRKRSLLKRTFTPTPRSTSAADTAGLDAVGDNSARPTSPVPEEQDDVPATTAGPVAAAASLHYHPVTEDSAAGAPDLDVEPGPTMTSTSAAFGAAASTDTADDVARDTVPRSPAFSNFTSVNDMLDDTTHVPEASHARHETVDSMPGYALNFQPPDTPKHAVVPQYQTRAAALLAPQSQSQAGFPARESSIPFRTSEASLTSKTASELQTPADSSSSLHQQAHSNNDEFLDVAQERTVEAGEEEENEDGAPRPDTQERLATASSRWAELRKNAHERRVSEQTDSAQTTPPWQAQQPVSNEYASQASGFSPGPAKTGLGIAGVQGIEAEKVQVPQEESIEARVARIKARVAELTGGDSN